MTALKAALAASVLILAAGTAQASNSIVDVAARAGTFGTLLAAATAAGLADELDEVQGLTVLAPTDAAFAKLPAGTVQDLLKPQNKGKLRAIIAYHVIPGTVLARNIPAKPRLVETLNGCERVRAERQEGRVLVDGVKVVKADIRASNGVVHVIDSVLIPERICD
jgi:uncharacterized surface protein with fasciclin (FAS1) repeats